MCTSERLFLYLTDLSDKPAARCTLITEDLEYSLIHRKTSHPLNFTFQNFVFHRTNAFHSLIAAYRILNRYLNY